MAKVSGPATWRSSSQAAKPPKGSESPDRNAQRKASVAKRGLPVERLESGWRLFFFFCFFGLVYVSRGTLPPKKKGQKGTCWGTQVS